jgi:two-component system OmpR family response regulator
MSKILIVDDENDFCEIMKNYFVKKGYKVLLASTLHEGLDLIKKDTPDILFLDNNLPDGQGWDHVDEIVDIIPQSRVFLISAHKNKYHFKSKKTDHSITVWEKPISLRVMDDFF